MGNIVLKSLIIVLTSFAISCSPKESNDTLIIKEIATDPTLSAKDIDSLFAINAITYQSIDKDNWNVNGGYNPDVKFALAHSNNYLLLQYYVIENDIRATFGEDFKSRPYLDSCVEFFWKSHADSISYYNLEMNCIGYGLFAKGDKIVKRNNIDREIHEDIERYSTLGSEPFGTKSYEENGNEPYQWKLSLLIPATSLFPSEENPVIKGRTILANFYKCGSEMPQSHYLSWKPIQSERPNFHQPQFFGEILFE